MGFMLATAALAMGGVIWRISTGFASLSTRVEGLGKCVENGFKENKKEHEQIFSKINKLKGRNEITAG